MKQSELEHHRKISERAEQIWGWGSPAGQARAKRRADLLRRAGLLRNGQRVLELGCGTGIFSSYFCQAGIELTAIDICQELLDQAKGKKLPVSFEIGDAENLTFEAGRFDAVIGSSVLHHLDLPKTLAGAFRILKSGGHIAFAEPNMMNPQIMVQKNVPFIKRRMGDSEEETAFFRWPLKNQLARAGFRDIQVVPFDFLHPLVPENMIPSISKISQWLEQVPGIREIAGSLLITAQKPQLA